MKISIVWGASLKSNRYSHQAVLRLINKGVSTFAFGLKEGEIGGVSVKNDSSYFRTIPNINTLTLYLSPKHQEAYLPLWLAMKPERIIFNPGTENPILYPALRQAGIQVEEACTLVLLSTNQY